MNIQNYITNDIKANELNEKVDEMLTNLFKELNGFYCTRFIINKYVPVIEQLTSDYNSTFNQKCYITSYKNNTMNDYIGRKSSKRLKYSIDSYFKAVQFEVALLLAKYPEIHECQIKLAFMNTLLSNYMYYTIVAFDNSYSLEFDINIIKNQYLTIMNTELKDFPLIKENETIKNDVYNNSKRSGVKESFVPTKPTKIEHLTDLFEDGMTQREKVKAIANYWDCTEKTAENYMKKFDLWIRVKNVNVEESSESNNELELYKTRCELLQNDLNEANQEIEQLKQKIKMLESQQMMGPSLQTLSLDAGKKLASFTFSGFEPSTHKINTL